MKIKNLLILILPFLLSGCFVYNSQFSPPILIEQKGEVQLNGGFTYNLLLPSYYGSVTYGISDQFYGQLYSVMGYENNTSFYEASLAWYKPSTSNFRFGIHAGYFYGDAVGASIGISTTDYSYSYAGNYQAPFIIFQSILKREKTIWSFGCKLAYFNTHLQETKQPFLFNNGEPMAITPFNNKALLIEPLFSFIPNKQSIYKNFALTIGYSHPFFIPIKSPYYDFYENTNPYGNFSFGIKYSFSINDIFQSK